MKILTSAHYLDLSGVPTYTLTMVNELKRLGHDVEVFTIAGGELEKPLNAKRYTDELHTPDIIIAQANSCAYLLRNQFPITPMIFSAHGVLPILEQPPVRNNVQLYTAINEEVAANLMRNGVPHGKIEIVRDFVDTEKFKSTVPVNGTAKKALFVSNFKKGKTWPIVQQACELSGIYLGAVGAPYGRSRDVAADINGADLVISTARGVLEAMSCARPVVVFGQETGDGYITSEVYMDGRRRNFAGIGSRLGRVSVEDLMREIAMYDAWDGAQNRHLILRYHNVTDGVQRLLSLAERLL